LIGPRDGESRWFGLDPFDPNCASVAQMCVLGSMGYPVRLEVIPESDVPDEYLEQETDLVAYGGKWLNAYVHDDFREMLDHPEGLCAQAALGVDCLEEMPEELWDHPFQIYGFVAHRPAQLLRHTNRMYSAGNWEAKEWVPTYERMLVRLGDDITSGLVELYEPNQDCLPLFWATHSELKQRGVQAFNPEGLFALTEDFYRRIEKMGGPFMAFKQGNQAA
jgi:hypothetical protein